MAPLLFLSALAAATPAATMPPADAAARDAANGTIMLGAYPAGALAAGEQGAVGFKVTLDRDGYAAACEVTHSSGYKRLDDETCQLILNRSTFRGVKDGDGRKVSSVHRGVVNWTLPATAAVTPATAPVRMAASTKSEKKVCRRRVRTGSLSGFERLCATQADWDRMAERTREEWGAIQGSAGSSRGN